MNVNKCCRHSGHALIVSLKYSAGLAKEFHLIGKKLDQHGYRVKYLLSLKYMWHGEFQRGADVRFFSWSLARRLVSQLLGTRVVLWPNHDHETVADNDPDFICFYNLHPLNILLAYWAAHAYPDSIRTIYLHEPRKTNKRVMGLRKGLLFHVVEILQSLCMRWVNHITVPSPNALAIFRRFYPDYPGRVHLAPILIPDSAASETSPREHVTMVGTVFRDGRMRAFCSLVEHATAKGEEVRFRIVTTSNISQDLQKLSARARDNLQVINPARLSDEEINRHVRSSIAVLSMHTQGTQSGVTPVAFMNSTPIIARDLPLFSQFIKHSHNGYLVPADASPEDWLAAIHFVRDNFSELSANARATFETVFHERNWERYYGWLLDALQC